MCVCVAEYYSPALGVLCLISIDFIIALYYMFLYW